MTLTLMNRNFIGSSILLARKYKLSRVKMSHRELQLAEVEDGLFPTIDNPHLPQDLRVPQ